MCVSEHFVIAPEIVDACIVNLFKAHMNKCFITEQMANLIFGGPCIVIHSYKKNQRDALISEIYFRNRTLRVSDRFSVHHQEPSAVCTAVGVCHTGFADCLRAGSGWNWFPDDGQKTCSKQVEFYSKNKFEKLVHVIGFIVRKE